MNQNTILFTDEKASKKNVVCEMSAILFRRRWAKACHTWRISVEAERRVDGCFLYSRRYIPSKQLSDFAV